MGYLFTLLRLFFTFEHVLFLQKRMHFQSFLHFLTAQTHYRDRRLVPGAILLKQLEPFTLLFTVSGGN